MADVVALMLRFFHILFGITWIGAVAYGVVVLRSALGRVEPPARKATMRQVIPVVIRYVPGSAVLTILMGALLYGWLGGFDPGLLVGTGWGLVLLAALILALITFGIGMLFGVRMARKILVHLEEESCTHQPEVGGLQARFNQVQFVVLGLGLAIIALMVVATTHAI